MFRQIYSITLSAAVALALSSGVFAQEHDHAAMNMPAPSTGAKTKLVVYTTPAAFKGQLDGVYSAYLGLQASLSRDSFSSPSKSVGDLYGALKKVDMKLLTEPQTHMAWMTASATLTKYIGQVADAKDIEAARAAFKPLSKALIAIAKQFGTSGKTPLYVFHCPMALKNAGADWVQADKTVKNPYFGHTMPTCGKITETLPSGIGR